MSTDAGRVDPIEPQATAASEGEAWEGILDDAPCWPVTRLVAVTFTALLGLAILAPALIARAHGSDWPVLLLPAAVATLSARALYETLVSASRGRGIVRHLLCALIPSLLAVLVIGVTAAIVGVGFSLLLAASTGVLTAITLTAAGAARDVEIRVRLSLRRVYFIGSREAQRELARELARRNDASLVGSTNGTGWVHRARLLESVRETRATAVVLDRVAMESAELVEVASALNLAGVQIRDLVSYYESEFKKVPLAELSPTWFLFDIAPLHQSTGVRLMRRACELLLAGLVLLIASPMLLAAVVAIKLTSRGPAFYRQQRVGKDGAPFTLVKLRTMTVPDASAVAQAAWAGSHADRITPVGQFLRRFRLDELPQLWTVLRGDLALIGPRPEQVPIAAELDRALPHYNARHAIRPGITGWAQVNLGYAGSVEGTVAKLQRDLYYVKHSSIRLDALILWLTFKTVISGRG